MPSSKGMVLGVVVTRGYGATTYIVGHGEKFQRVSSRAPDAGGQNPISDFPEIQDILPSDIDQEETVLFEVKRFGGFSSIERATEELRKVGVNRIIE